MAPDEVWFPATWVDILWCFSSDSQTRGKKPLQMRKEAWGGVVWGEKENSNKETFLFNPKGYFLAFSSLGKALLGVRAWAGWHRRRGRASPVPSCPFPPSLARSCRR